MQRAAWRKYSAHTVKAWTNPSPISRHREYSGNHHPVADDYKFQLIEKIVNNADFSAGKVNTMDGIRVDFSNGWGLVRASNTGPH